MSLDTTPTQYVLISRTCQAKAMLLTWSGPAIMYSNSNAVFIKEIFFFNIKQHGAMQRLTFGLTEIKA
jgi:hypothetical protein